MANVKQCFASRDKGAEMSAWFIGLAGGYGNDGGIIPLKEAVNISNMWSAGDWGWTTKRETVGRPSTGRMDFLPALSLRFTTAQT